MKSSPLPTWASPFTPGTNATANFAYNLEMVFVLSSVFDTLESISFNERGYL